MGGVDIYFKLKLLYNDMIEHFRINRMTDLFNSFIPNFIDLLESCLSLIKPFMKIYYNQVSFLNSIIKYQKMININI